MSCIDDWQRNVRDSSRLNSRFYRELMRLLILTWAAASSLLLSKTYVYLIGIISFKKAYWYNASSERWESDYFVSSSIPEFPWEQSGSFILWKLSNKLKGWKRMSQSCSPRSRILIQQVERNQHTCFASSLTGDGFHQEYCWAEIRINQQAPLLVLSRLVPAPRLHMVAECSHKVT